MWYFLARKILFKLDPETAHAWVLKGLNIAYFLGFLSIRRFIFRKNKAAPIELMGLSFANPVGLAAGLDKNADYIDALGALGFGFIEIGTVTPKAQSGNARPRLFRLEKQAAIINRMGFNNKGLDYLVQQLAKSRYKGVLGINIGKNRDTPLEQAVEDYLVCFKHVAPYASYVTINISSPNTAGLRDLQQSELLQELLHKLKQAQRSFFELSKKYVPLVVKIAPDLLPEEINLLANVLLQGKIDGVIATNTTISREGVADSVYSQELGGLSGKPLSARSTEVISALHAILQDQIPIIGCGGIMSEKDAKEKFAAGAKLVQLYTGLVYAGPGLIRACS
jgi:dihydroorotate dehydrogenase